MKIQIKNRWNGSVLFETDAESLGDATVAAIEAKVNLRDANLRDANLRDANLRDANLRDADLRDADLRGADLRGADLRGANLRDADLRGADLCDADLRDADLQNLISQRLITQDGELVVWKKLQNGVICKLKIPAEAKRIGGLVGRKCRAEFAIVLDGEGKSIHDGTVYKVGEMIRPDRFDPNPLVECSNGIHFFITRKEAEDYN